MGGLMMRANRIDTQHNKCNHGHRPKVCFPTCLSGLIQFKYQARPREREFV